MGVAGHRCGDDERIHVRCVDQLQSVVRGLDPRITLGRDSETFPAGIAHSNHPRAFRLREIAHQVGTPVAKADRSKADHKISAAAVSIAQAGLRWRTSPTTRAGTPATIA